MKCLSGLVAVGWTMVVLGSLVARLSAAELQPQQGEQLFHLIDKDGNGKLTPEELPRTEWFKRLDQNQDGSISVQEASVALSFLNETRQQRLLRADTSGTIASPRPETPPLREGPVVLKPGDAGVGRLLPDVPFTDLQGKSHKLSEQKSKLLVIALTSTTCPVSKRYAPALARLERQWASQGVKFIFVNPTPTKNVAALRTEARTRGFHGPYVQDADQSFIRALGASTSTEVFLIDAARTVLYRGAVDDQYGLGYSLEKPRRQYLLEAVQAALQGKTPEVAATTAPGCALEIKPGKSNTSQVTYHNRISRIVQNNCLECHRTGGVAPFSLETYEDVQTHAAMIRRQVTQGAMPPWFAAPPPPGTPSPWINDLSLAVADKADLLAWLSSDLPVGNPAEAPLPRRFPEGWKIGKPDQVVQIPQPIAVKAEGTMPYQHAVVELNLKEDQWVQALEVQPTAREVVHHVIVQVRPSASQEQGFDEERAERQGFFAAYVPGNSTRIYSPGFARKLPAGSRLHFQIHYTPNGTATTDQTRLGIIYAKEPPQHVVQVAGIANHRINIPPGAEHHVETAQLRVPFEAHVYDFLPHLHVRGKAYKYEVEYPDGRRQVLLDVPRYDFNWQLSYKLAEPVKLPAGSIIRTTAIYDNSANNPANPDPTRTVRWGPQTYDEMMLGYLEFYSDGNQSLRSNRTLSRGGSSGE